MKASSLNTIFFLATFHFRQENCKEMYIAYLLSPAMLSIANKLEGVLPALKLKTIHKGKNHGN